ncbi:hypothetical protein T4B_6551 [Trichinella pseudospiralis]|uniref:Uncharacterized protein n=1 Tax=Trichinella pseudospiralis TaxID=6337 RepID=A0A0V1IG21_TRIPS|nr:hypothetical protein T4B_6551 [Trichinella pseudospiralis]
MPSQRKSNQRQEVMELTAFKQYGCLPSFDFDEFKGPFDIWLKKWNVFLSLSTISLTLLEEYRCNKLTTRKQHANESIGGWLSDLHSIASKCEFPSHCCGDGETIRLLGQVIFGVNNDDKWHLEQASQLKHDDVGSHHRAALSAIGICSAKAPSSNTSTPQRQATNAAVQLTENDATHAGKLVNMAQYAERATMRETLASDMSRHERLNPLSGLFSETASERAAVSFQFRIFSSPTAASGLRAFFSLCEEVRNLSNKVASVLKPLTCLLKNSAIWEWTENTDTDALSRSLVSTADELSDGLLSVPAKVALLCSIAGSDNKVIDLTKDSGKRQTDLDNRPRGGQRYAHTGRFIAAQEKFTFELWKSHESAKRPFDQCMVLVDQFNGWLHAVSLPNSCNTSRHIVGALVKCGRQYIITVLSTIEWVHGSSHAAMMPVHRHPDHLTKTNSAEASSCTTIPRPSVLKERPNGEISVGYAYRSKKWTRTRYRSSVKVYIKATLIERPQASTQRPRKATNQ